METKSNQKIGNKSLLKTVSAAVDELSDYFKSNTSGGVTELDLFECWGIYQPLWKLADTMLDRELAVELDNATCWLDEYIMDQSEDVEVAEFDTVELDAIISNYRKLIEKLKEGASVKISTSKRSQKRDRNTFNTSVRIIR